MVNSYLFWLEGFARECFTLAYCRQIWGSLTTFFAYTTTPSAADDLTCPSRHCPVFDNERDILYDGYYLTMTRRGGITLSRSRRIILIKGPQVHRRELCSTIYKMKLPLALNPFILGVTPPGVKLAWQELFNAGFYIVFIVKSSDEDCLGKDLPENATGSRLLLWKHRRDEYETNEKRFKTFRFRITETISYTDYITGSIVILGFFLFFYIALILVVIFNGTKKLVSNSQPSTCSSGGTEDNVLNVITHIVMSHVLRLRLCKRSDTNGRFSTWTTIKPGVCIFDSNKRPTSCSFSMAVETSLTARSG
ncbi:hypothetical protein EVAR_41888_1 [Eumeta japonica]|uniref:Uncharacterized protein n=1 Tax=Eumeta variegata TaxID=151549 RepID=A0A4C1YP31_EUMVA|nr:hypothetical protein EVAR_41888_1 [Eumeta japonica]